MPTSKPLDKLLFLDIETTSQYATFDEMPQEAKTLFFRRWEKDIFKLADELFDDSFAPKTESPAVTTVATTPQKWGLNRATTETYNRMAPIYAEFNKVICISMGTLSKSKSNPNDWELRVVSITGENEKELLEKFLFVARRITDIKKLSDFKGDESTSIVAHNGLYFDLPVLAKRMIYNGINPPFMLTMGSIANLKPWDVKWVIDTKDLWKMGVFDAIHNTSLDQLAYNFGVPSSKSVMQGKDVKDVYWNGVKAKPEGGGINFGLKNAITKIETYCEADVLALARVYFKMFVIPDTITPIRLELDKVVAMFQKMDAEAKVKAGAPTTK